MVYPSLSGESQNTAMMRRRERRYPYLKSSLNTVYRAFRLYSANRSMKAWGVFARHLYRSRVLKKPNPPFITIAPTYRCPCSCVHCGIYEKGRRGEAEISTLQIKSVIDQAKRLGVLQVTFTGGEPMMRQDLYELIRYAHIRGLLTRLNTSGLFLSKSNVTRLKSAGLTQCAVSIDDADPAIHDRLRGVPGAFDCALRGIGYLKDAGIPCQINTYASRRMVTRGLEKIITLGRRLGVLAVYIIMPVAIGRWNEMYSRVLSEEEKSRVRALQEMTFVHLELATDKTLCGVYQKGILFVSPQGQITPCPFVSFPFGNIADLSLKNVWMEHCSRLRETIRGECPMNDPGRRKELARHVRSVALCAGKSDF